MIFFKIPTDRSAIGLGVRERGVLIFFIPNICKVVKKFFLLKHCALSLIKNLTEKYCKIS